MYYMHCTTCTIACATGIRSDKLPNGYMNSPHVTSEMPNTTNGHHMPRKIKHFLKSRSQEMPIRISYKSHLFVSYDCHSFLVISKLKGISDVYLEPSRTSSMELFCENN